MTDKRDLNIYIGRLPESSRRIIREIVEEEKREAVAAKDNAYWERNQLVANLASNYESHMVRHPDKDAQWEDDWRWIVCVHTPAGQMTWHIHDNDVQTFGFLPVEPDAGHWDGHTTEEKYKRLAALTHQKQTGGGDEHSS